MTASGDSAPLCSRAFTVSVTVLEWCDVLRRWQSRRGAIGCEITRGLHSQQRSALLRRERPHRYRQRRQKRRVLITDVDVSDAVVGVQRHVHVVEEDVRDVGGLDDRANHTRRCAVNSH